MTTQGQDLKKISGTVYAGSHNGEEQRILWFTVGDKTYPTVYTLWKNPGLVPLLHTIPNVIEKMQGGADLMTPGLAFGPPFPANARKGAVVAVASTTKPSVPSVVGTCEIDISGLQAVQGAKGHAVENMHWVGDEAWAWSPLGKPGVSPPDSIQGWMKESGDTHDVEQKIEQFALNPDGEQTGGVSLQQQDQSPAREMEGEITTKEEEPNDQEVEKEFTIKEIDTAFRNAFLYGVHHYKEKNKDEKNFGLEFPLSQSFVMSNLVQPFLPAFTPAQASQLQIKKTSWKNIKKFIRSLDKDLIIKSKERDGNEVVVFDIDFEDRHVLNFTPYPLPKKESTGAASANKGGKSENVDTTGDPSVGQKLKVLILYKPKEKLSPLFEPSSSDPQAFYSLTDLRPMVDKYIEEEELINEKNKRLVKLDPFLANTVITDKNNENKGYLEKGVIPRDTLMERIRDSCSSYHVILRSGSSDDDFTSGKPKSGNVPKILITLETRSGNKTVTKISGLEAFYVPPQPLADELRKVCAGSTSVDQLVGSSSKNPVMEVMVQGPQKDAVIKSLEKRGVDKRWIEVVDKTKKKKG